VRSYGAAPIRSLASRSTSAWARAWRLARRKSTSPATPALRSTSKSATLSIATVFGSSSALDGYPNARNHAVALLSRCHRIYTTFRDLDVRHLVRWLGVAISPAAPLRVSLFHEGLLGARSGPGRLRVISGVAILRYSSNFVPRRTISYYLAGNASSGIAATNPLGNIL